MQTVYQKTRIIGIAVLLLFINLTSLQAVPKTWVLLGGGNWNNPVGWAPLGVPTAADEVTITVNAVNIPAGVSAVAKNVIINPGAKLKIFFSGSLHLEGAVDKSALRNEGTMIVNGELKVRNVSQFIALPNFANGILNKSFFQIGASGNVFIKSVDKYGFFNEGTLAQFKNRGDLWIDDCAINGLNNTGRIDNFGHLQILQPTNPASAALFNSGIYKNRNAGFMLLRGGEDGIVNSGVNAEFHNANDVFCNNVSAMGIRNEGKISNDNFATITIDTSGNANIYNGAAGIINNNADFFLQGNSPVGIRNYGQINNFEGLDISRTSSIGLLCFSGSTFENHGKLAFNLNQQRDLRLFGGLLNYDTGEIIQRKTFNIRSSGVLINNGYINSQANATHTLAAGGVFDNNGLIGDTFNKFTGIVNNLQVIVGPITAQLTQGVAYIPALQVADTSNISFGNWSLSSTIYLFPGNYSSMNNSFTPFNAAPGATELYPDLTILSSGKTYTTKIRLLLPIVMVTNRRPQQVASPRSEETNLDNPSAHIDFSIFPNPTSGSVQIKANNLSTTSEVNLSVTNTLGQTVYQQELPAAELFNFQLPSGLSAGNYFINIFLDQEFFETQRIQLTH